MKVSFTTTASQQTQFEVLGPSNADYSFLPKSPQSVTMSTTSGASTGILDLSEDLHLYLCQSLYPRHINNLARTCKQLHHRLNPELWKLGTATPDGKD